jgi:hypothetical protein
MSDSMKLLQVLDDKTGDDSVDHLGKYHLWLTRHGIKPETEWGWFTEESFDDTNINAYCNDYVNRHVY